MFVRNNSNFKIILFIILAVFSIWAIFQIKEIAMLFFASYVLACSLNPFVDKMSTKIPRGIATTIAILVSGFLLLLVLEKQACCQVTHSN